MSKAKQFGEGLSLSAWSLRALGMGALLIVLGAGLGGGLALTFSTETGGIAALCLVAVGGGFWAFFRLGGAGFGLGVMGGIAAMLGAMELRHAVVVNRSMTSLASLADWDPGSSASVLRVAPLEGDERYVSVITQTHRGARGSGGTTSAYRVLPWTERGRIVGFACTESRGKGTSGASGAYALSTAAWDGALDDACQEGIRASEQLARAAGVEVAPGSARRIVRVYASEADLRGDHDAALAFWGPGVFLGLYLGAVLIYRAMQDGKKPGAAAASRRR